MKKTLLFVTAMASIPGAASAVTVSLTDDAAELAAATLASSSGITIQAGSETLIGDAEQQGTYSNFNEVGGGGQPTLTTEDGIVLTTGGGNFSTSENTSNAFSGASSQGSFQPLVDLADANDLSTFQNDSNVLSFDFVLDDPTANSVTASFLFASDEFPTQSVTDIMAVFVNGENFAFFPNGDLVSNQSGDPNDFFNDNSVGTGNYGIEWNGLTDVFGITALANGGGAVNTIEIAIADTSDQIYDSALFFGNLSSGSTTSGGGIGPVVEPIAPSTPSTPPSTVVPLPAGAWLLLTGLVGLGAASRSKKRS